MNTTDLKPIPPRPNLEQYKKQAKELVRAVSSSEPDAIERVTKYHPRFSSSDSAKVARAGFVLADAQLVLSREHGFESWPKFTKHLQELTRKNSPVTQFELAADAIVNGDAETLMRLLRENPDLIRARSPRVHQAALIHYVAANGFENYRQKTPKNIVQILKILLAAGANVDQIADTYGKGTTLGLVATSVHPKRAGLQREMLEILLDAGASLNGAPGGWNPLVASLHNGRGEAAEFLAQRGAEMDLEGAAGVGRLDLVKSFFNRDGSLKATASAAQMRFGFMWACQYGHNEVVEYLLDRGMDIQANENSDLTGLHWAAVGGHLETIKLLVKRGANLEALNRYGGTVLDQALWMAYHEPAIDYVPTIKLLIKLGSRIDVYPEMKGYVDQILKGKPTRTRGK